MTDEATSSAPPEDHQQGKAKSFSKSDREEQLQAYSSGNWGRGSQGRGAMRYSSFCQQRSGEVSNKADRGQIITFPLFLHEILINGHG